MVKPPFLDTQPSLETIKWVACFSFFKAKFLLVRSFSLKDAGTKIEGSPKKEMPIAIGFMYGIFVYMEFQPL